MILFAVSTIFSIMSNLFIVGESEFFYHKKMAEELYGPCEWKYVGKQTDVQNPALLLKPPVGENYILWRQVCENDPHRKDKD